MPGFDGDDEDEDIEDDQDLSREVGVTAEASAETVIVDDPGTTLIDRYPSETDVPLRPYGHHD